MLSIEQIKQRLHLLPHPAEGGFFVETYRSALDLPKDVLPGYPSSRSASTAIYYLITPDGFSAMHRLRGDEIFHFYLGDPVELLQIKADRAAEIVVLGHDIISGMKLQHVVPAGAWQGSRLRTGGEYALLGTTVAPGFDYQDFEIGKRHRLVREFPRYKEIILGLTR